MIQLANIAEEESPNNNNKMSQDNLQSNSSSTKRNKKENVTNKCIGKAKFGIIEIEVSSVDSS